mgnify:FL=1
MENLFLLLFLASFVCLIIGLVKPTAFSRFFKDKANRKFVGLVFGISTVLFFILFGVTPNKSTLTTSTNNAVTKAETPATTPTLSYSFDMPSLLGKNIDEVRLVLGAPLNKDLTEPTAEQLKLGVEEWDNSYKKDGQELLVTFNPSTRKIVDFFLSGDNKAKLIEAGNLKENDSNYTIEQVKQLKNPSAITGIKIIPKKKAESTAQEVKTPKYQIVYELSNKRYDGGKNYYVLIDPVNLSSDSFKNDIKTIAKKIVTENGNKISIEIHDKKTTLDLSYKQYGNMSLGRVLNQSELDERAIHLIADFSGDLETNIYLNSLSFFPGAFENNTKVGKYLETIEFDASK